MKNSFGTSIGIVLAAALSTAASERLLAQDVKTKTEGGISVSTDDGRFSAQLGGLLQIDAAAYDEDKNKLGSGTELRRARLNMQGTMFGDWGYEFSIDVAGGDVDIKDAFVSYEHERFRPIQLLIGQYKEPFSLEELTSSKYLTFMERALPNVFAPGRNIGVGFQTYSELWTAAAGIFGESFDSDVKAEGDEGYGITGRFTYAPFRTDTRALHFGAALSYRKANDEKQARFNARPESHVTNVKYLDTGSLKNVDNVRRAGVEFAAVLGRFSAQAEYARVDVARASGFEDLTFDGWYVFFSWFLTGEARDYRFKRGVFGRVEPRGKLGAWELAARYSKTDLNDGAVKGGEEKNVTLGLNWYINKRLRFMANYIIVDNDDKANANGSVVGKDKPKIFQARFQVDF